MNNHVPSLSGKQLKQDWPLVVLLVVSFALGLFLYPQLPERVPTNWNVHGEIGGYSGKFFAAFGMPLFNLVLYVLLLVLPGLDPKRENYPKFAKLYDLVRWSVVGLMVLVHTIILLAGLGHSINVGKIVQIAVAIMFILLGNQMGRVKHNYFVGIRTPWTLANEEVWRMTHRMAGPVFVAGGFLALGSTWLPAPYNFAGMMVGVIASSLVALVYSYVIYRKLTKS